MSDTPPLELKAQLIEILGRGPADGPMEIEPLNWLLHLEEYGLIADAFGVEEVDVPAEVDRIMNERRKARAREVIPMLDMDEIRCQRGCTEHKTRKYIVELFGQTPYADYPPVPEDLWDVFFIEGWDVDSQGEGEGYCPAADAISMNLDQFRIWEPVETITLLRCFREIPDAIFVDIGAQLGYYSVLAERAGLHVVAIEADPDVAELLSLNVIHGRHRRHSQDIDVFERRVGIDTMSLPIYGDDLIVKIDIEGAEAEAVSFLHTAIAENRVKYALIEISPFFRSGYADLVLGLRARGFRIFEMPPKQTPPHPLDDIRRDLLPFEVRGSHTTIRNIVNNWEQRNVLFVHDSTDWPPA